MERRTVVAVRGSAGSPRYSRLRSEEEEEEEKDEEEEVEEDEEAEDTEPARPCEALLQLAERYPTFWGHFKLSFVVAVWMTVFGAFSYSDKWRRYAFGDGEKCSEVDVNWVEFSDGRKVWCGWLPNSYLPYWPNAVQMIIFTVYTNTGITIRQAWQGVAGTACAVANLYIMQLLFPDGTDNVIVWCDIFLFFFVVLASGAAINTMKFALTWHAFFMMTYLDPNTLSGSQPGAFPTGLPNLDWDSEGMVALVSSFFGAFVAILATLFLCPPLTNFNKVVDDADSIVTATDKIWTEAITYACGPASSAKRFQIQEAVTSLNRTVADIQGNLNNSWWENFDLCNYGRRRALYNLFDILMQNLHDVMVVMGDTLMKLSFDDAPTQSQFSLQGSLPTPAQFRFSMRGFMLRVKECTVELLHDCVRACADGYLDRMELDRLQRRLQAMISASQDMHAKYTEMSRTEQESGARFVSQRFSKENIFLFALGTWSRRIAEFANAISEFHLNLEVKGHAPLETIGKICTSGLHHTLQCPPSRESRMFAVRNFVAIAGSFFVAYILGQSKSESLIFPPYSSTMPATLALLIHANYSGGTILNNLNRLLGVTVGRVLPLVILAGLENMSQYVRWLECGRVARDVAVGVSILLLTWIADYMYFSSPRFGTIGCLMSAYGAGILSGSCGQVVVNLGSKYSEIAQIVCALSLQVCVDVAFDAMADGLPRDKAVQAIADLHIFLKESYESFFAGNVQQAREHQREFKAKLSDALKLVVEADPSLELVTCYRTPFKIDLYTDACKILELLKADLAMIILASEVWKAERLSDDGLDLEILEKDWKFSFESDEEAGVGDVNGNESLLPYLRALNGVGSIKEEFMMSLRVVLTSLYNLLNHAVEDDKFQEEEETKTLVSASHRKTFQNVESIISEINATPLQFDGSSQQLTENRRVRLTVALGCLCQAKAHLVQLDKLLLKRIILYPRYSRN